MKDHLSLVEIEHEINLLNILSSICCFTMFLLQHKHLTINVYHSTDMYVERALIWASTSTTECGVFMIQRP